jgi:flagellar FliJ protein
MSDTNSLHALTLLLEQAERSRDEALARQQQAEDRLRAAEGQASQLSDYRGQTERRWSAQFREGATVTLLHCYQGFIGRLHGAEDQQAGVVERTREDLERCRAETLAEEQRVFAVRKLIERRQLALRQRADRQEQKLFDEMGTRAAWGQGASMGALR